MKPSAIVVFNSLLFILINLALAPVASAYYDPSLARWINRDPLDEKGFRIGPQANRSRVTDGPNLHTFVSNEPLSKVDFHGLLGGWGYGNHCGYSRSGNLPPVDQVDAACEKHDRCLATWGDVLTPGKFLCCNVAFCSRVAVGDCSGSPNPTACENAKLDILTLCALVLSNPMTGL